MIIVLGISEQEDFHRPEIPLEKTREIDNEARISKKAEMKRKFSRNQKRITLWDIQLSSLILMIKSRDSSVNVVSVFVLSIIFCYHIKSLLIVSNFLKIDKAVVSNWYQNLHDKLSRECVRFKDNIPPTYRLDEDVLKTFSRRLSSSSSKAVLKTTWSRRKYSP